jgi:cell division protein FtsI (penicillin-binding protein 3)
MKPRVVLVLAGLALWSVAIEARLVQLQVFQHAWLVKRANSQQHDLISTSAMRGDIVDREGRVLAYSVDASSIMAYPVNVQNPAAVAGRICGALGDCTTVERAALARRLGGKAPFFVRRARAVSPEQAARVKELGIPFIQLMPEALRFYPQLELAAHVLGFVDPDNKGLGGVESARDSDIRGTPGKAIVQVDAHGNWMQTRIQQAATAGATVELTLDLTLQHIAERELRAGVLANRARGGTAIVMDPYTGAILALANYPTFNPNIYGRVPDDVRRNRATQEVYEPGSTFKLVTASAAIEEGVISPDDTVDCNPGYITFPGRKPIREASGHNYGVLTFEDVIVKSSNVCAIKVGLRVGAERLSRYVRRFGFGTPIGSEFMGESGGKVWAPADLDDSALASMSMGYQVSVTPLQMAAAASAVGNGGTLVEPHVIGAFVRHGTREVIEPKVLRRAISAETAATVTTIMEDVVLRGTAKAARLDHHQVAGKTGTAAKLVDGRYSSTDYNASFVGFVPSRKPAFTILVVIDTPHAGPTTGGGVSAPVFKRIAEAAIQHIGLAPTLNPAPAVTIAAVQAFPPPAPSRPTLIPALTELGGRSLMPDVRGLAVRDALRLLSRAGLQVRANGNGFVATQSPAPGEPVESGSWSVLQLRRTPPDPRELGAAPR